MIINLVLNVISSILSAIFSFVPEVNIASIWFIGEFVREILIDMVGYWNSFMITFPYAEISWNVFLFAIIPFELAMIVLKFFLGNRTPANHN